MNSEDLYSRYQELQQYTGWCDEDAHRVSAIAGLLDPHVPSLIDDFYAEIERHPNARKVITGGQAQVERLKGTLMAWIRELLAGNYDHHYVRRRWQVGWRHVEIGLDQVYTNVALSRLRTGLTQALQENFAGPPDELTRTVRSLNKLLDLDLAIIEDAYQAEHLARQQRTERLAAIGQVAGGVAHELRNPLNVVKTSIYYLLNARNPTAAKTAEHLGRIEKHIVVADSVITALSNFTRMPLPNLHSVSVADSLSEALALNPVSDNINVIFDCPPTLPAALADAEQLRIVLGNLIRNAREAMAGGGTLSLRARQMDDTVEISIEDTGIGIPKENLIRIMEPLYSTKARGLGLGLAMVRAILEKNKGSLRVTSEEGAGSAFTVTLMAALE